ncbi:acyltransferase [Sinorhizobium sp. BG8]|uniref:acyltransferase n=1 Tax=Sinorhizobium sp. BG8 TaxID=2613773 RepID=UPI00193CFD7E|nr:acyltransferase [Sinorhizobium sp. BG8]QRM56201.1 acyltransferase [Sinorhizobium sp. BG8]
MPDRSQIVALAKDVIAGFSLADDPQVLGFRQVYAEGSNRVFARDDSYQAVTVTFGTRSRGCTVYVCENFRGHASVRFDESNSVVYIGASCRLRKTVMRARSHNSYLLVGNGVTTTGRNTWACTAASDTSPNVLIIGDDCMFAAEVTVRTTDGHPVYDVRSGRIRNTPLAPVVIEPHVWIGKQVTILKSVRVGACSIVALRAVVTRDVPRGSLATGIPAQSKPLEGKVWARTPTMGDRRKAMHFYDRYCEGDQAITPDVGQKNGAAPRPHSVFGSHADTSRKTRNRIALFVAGIALAGLQLLTLGATFWNEAMVP